MVNKKCKNSTNRKSIRKNTKHNRYNKRTFKKQRLPIIQYNNNRKIVIPKHNDKKITKHRLFKKYNKKTLKGGVLSFSSFNPISFITSSLSITPSISLITPFAYVIILIIILINMLSFNNRSVISKIFSKFINIHSYIKGKHIFTNLPKLLDNVKKEIDVLLYILNSEFKIDTTYDTTSDTTSDNQSENQSNNTLYDYMNKAVKYLNDEIILESITDTNNKLNIYKYLIYKIIINLRFIGIPNVNLINSLIYIINAINSKITITIDNENILEQLVNDLKQSSYISMEHINVILFIINTIIDNFDEITIIHNFNNVDISMTYFGVVLYALQDVFNSAIPLLEEIKKLIGNATIETFKNIENLQHFVISLMWIFNKYNKPDYEINIYGYILTISNIINILYKFILDDTDYNTNNNDKTKIDVVIDKIIKLIKSGVHNLFNHIFKKILTKGIKEIFNSKVYTVDYNASELKYKEITVNELIKEYITNDNIPVYFDLGDTPVYEFFELDSILLSLYEAINNSFKFVNNYVRKSGVFNLNLTKGTIGINHYIDYKSHIITISNSSSNSTSGGGLKSFTLKVKNSSKFIAGKLKSGIVATGKGIKTGAKQIVKGAKKTTSIVITPIRKALRLQINIYNYDEILNSIQGDNYEGNETLLLNILFYNESQLAILLKKMKFKMDTTPYINYFQKIKSKIQIKDKTEYISLLDKIITLLENKKTNLNSTTIDDITNLINTIKLEIFNTLQLEDNNDNSSQPTVNTITEKTKLKKFYARKFTTNIVNMINNKLTKKILNEINKETLSNDNLNTLLTNIIDYLNNIKDILTCIGNETSCNYTLSEQNTTTSNKSITDNNTSSTDAITTTEDKTSLTKGVTTIDIKRFTLLGKFYKTLIPLINNNIMEPLNYDINFRELINDYITILRNNSEHEKLFSSYNKYKFIIEQCITEFANMFSYNYYTSNTLDNDEVNTFIINYKNKKTHIIQLDNISIHSRDSINTIISTNSATSATSTTSTISISKSSFNINFNKVKLYNNISDNDIITIDNANTDVSELTELLNLIFKLDISLFEIVNDEIKETTINDDENPPTPDNSSSTNSTVSSNDKNVLDVLKIKKKYNLIWKNICWEFGYSEYDVKTFMKHYLFMYRFIFSTDYLLYKPTNAINTTTEYKSQYKFKNIFMVTNNDDNETTEA
jgi:hypothetical protein